MGSKWIENPPKTNPERRDVVWQRRAAAFLHFLQRHNVFAVPLFLHHFHKVITLSYELNLGVLGTVGKILKCRIYIWPEKTL